jgi:hypothetical protein
MGKTLKKPNDFFIAFLEKECKGFYQKNFNFSGGKIADPGWLSGRSQAGFQAAAG